MIDSAQPLCSPNGRIAPNGLFHITDGSSVGAPWASINRPGRHALALLDRHARLAERDGRGRVVEHERMRLVRHGDAERVGRHARVEAAVRRDQRPRTHVDEVDRREPRARALLAPLADAREVVRVGEPDDDAAVGPRPLDRHVHRGRAERLAEAAVAVEAEHRPAIDDHARRTPCAHVAGGEVVDVLRDEPDAVRVVPGEVRVDQPARDLPRLARVAAERLEQARAPGDQGRSRDTDVVRLGSH